MNTPSPSVSVGSVSLPSVTLTPESATIVVTWSSAACVPPTIPSGPGRVWRSKKKLPVRLPTRWVARIAVNRRLMNCNCAAPRMTRALVSSSLSNFWRIS